MVTMDVIQTIILIASLMGLVKVVFYVLRYKHSKNDIISMITTEKEYERYFNSRRFS